MNPKDVNYLNQLSKLDKSKKAVGIKSGQELLISERERGFSTHFSGANKSAEKPLRAVVKRNGRLSLDAVAVSKRRGWNNEASSFPFAREMENDYGEEGFEEEEEEENDNLCNNLNLQENVILGESSRAGDVSIVSKEEEEKSLQPEGEESHILSVSPPKLKESYRELCIGVRLQSSWGKGGYLSLASLQLKSGDNDISLHNFQATLLNGLIPLPFSSPAYLNINKLFGSNRAVSRAGRKEEWKVPFAKGSSHIEIRLEGSVSIDFFPSLQLIIGNSTEVSQRVRDMDVYVDGSCVWSSEWSQADGVLPPLSIALFPSSRIKTTAAEASLVENVRDNEIGVLLTPPSQIDPIIPEINEDIPPTWLVDLKPLLLAHERLPESLPMSPSRPEGLRPSSNRRERVSRGSRRALPLTAELSPQKGAGLGNETSALSSFPVTALSAALSDSQSGSRRRHRASDIDSSTKAVLTDIGVQQIVGKSPIDALNPIAEDCGLIKGASYLFGNLAFF